MEVKGLVRFIVMVSLVSVMAGCALLRPAITTQSTETETIVETRRDTLIVTKADTALIKAYFYCDSLNRVVMERVMEKEGELIDLQFALDSTASDTIYRLYFVQATTPETFDSISWIERNKQLLKADTKTVEVKIKEPPWWMVVVILIETIILMFWSIYVIKIYLDSKRR
jgi:hypothetical protein